MEDIVQFDFPTDSPKIIKVIGVGGGGGNAVNHMYREGIHDVTFVLCNTDNQALKDSPVPVKLQLGKEGLGAGNRPARARKAAEESIEDIKNMLNDGTKMVFITAGMGGGTGTGAAPIIAQTAKEMDILTIGIVTIPFRWEGDKKIDQALDGVEEISKHVDALLVINNEKLSEIYSELSVDDAFDKADDTLSVAAKSIAEIITLHGKVNLDFNDVKTVLKDGGVAIMSTGYGEGDNRVSEAIKNAQHSPLLNNNDIFNSKKVLLNISYSAQYKLMMSEMESSRNTRRMAANPSSLARRMNDWRVEMMPSASVWLRIKSTATSLLARPAMRSTWTMANLPAAWIRCTSVEILQISPYRIKTTRIFSFCSAFCSPSSSLTAAMTGVS